MSYRSMAWKDPRGEWGCSTRMGYVWGMLFWIPSFKRPLWLKMEQVWMTLKMGSKNFKMNFQQNAIVALMASSWPTRGGWAPKAYSIVGWPLKQKGSCWTVPYGLKHKVIPTLRQLKYSVGRTGYNFTLHLYNYQYHLSFIFNYCMT